MAKAKASSQDGELPGMEKAGKLADVIRAAVHVETARDAFQAASKTLQEKQLLLTEVMRKHNILSYEYKDLTVTVTPGKDKVKVKRASDDDGEGEEE